MDGFEERESRYDMRKIFTRSIQKGLKRAANFIEWPEPELYVGANQFNLLPDKLLEKGMQTILIVTDHGIRKAGILAQFEKNLKNRDITYRIYDAVEANPTVEMAEKIAIHFNWIHADAIVAVGGGSVLDAAKAAGVVVSNPHKPLASFKGILKVREKTPYTIAVPTTAGTGSETTIATVLSDKETKEKFAIMSPLVTPDMAILDPVLTKSLPKALIAGPGMDALVHAIEAYLGHSNTSKTKEYARKTVRLVSENLKRAYDNREDTEARQNMLLAAFYGGKAFTRAYVGNIHAMSHALTAFYNTPHGSTNATILPIVLRLYKETVYNQLSELAYEVGLAQEENTEAENAQLFIEWIEELNATLNIATSIPEIKEEDLVALATHADSEANPLYPVPVIFTPDDFIKAYRIVKGEEE